MHSELPLTIPSNHNWIDNHTKESLDNNHCHGSNLNCAGTLKLCKSSERPTSDFSYVSNARLQVFLASPRLFASGADAKFSLVACHIIQYGCTIQWVLRMESDDVRSFAEYLR